MSQERFHIAEWYGHPFLALTDSERLTLADHEVGGAAMSKADLDRLADLEHQAELRSLTAREEKRLVDLRRKLERQQTEERPCPFKINSAHPTCTKPGGVCSIRIYGEDGGGSPQSREIAVASEPYVPRAFIRAVLSLMRSARACLAIPRQTVSAKSVF